MEMYGYSLRNVVSMAPHHKPIAAASKVGITKNGLIVRTPKKENYAWYTKAVRYN